MRNKNFWILLLLMLGRHCAGRLYRRDNRRRAHAVLAELRTVLRHQPAPSIWIWGILVITFGLSIKITMASIIGIVIALVVFRWI